MRRCGAALSKASALCLLIVHGRRVSAHETAAATSFIHGAADGHALFRFESALAVARRLAALHADGVSLGDVFRAGEQRRHRLQGLPV